MDFLIRKVNLSRYLSVDGQLINTSGFDRGHTVDTLSDWHAIAISCSDPKLFNSVV